MATKMRSEDELGVKLDRCMADTLLKFAGGGAIGVVASMILFKRKTWPVWFGSGIGLGIGYGNCQNDVRNPFLLHGKKVKAPSEGGKNKEDSKSLVIVEKAN